MAPSVVENPATPPRSGGVFFLPPRLSVRPRVAAPRPPAPPPEATLEIVRDVPPPSPRAAVSAPMEQTVKTAPPAPHEATFEIERNVPPPAPKAAPVDQTVKTPPQRPTPTIPMELSDTLELPPSGPGSEGKPKP